ncbi:glycosyltransferase [Achromobacter sp. ACM02]|uniref:glycosyltransferase n=1 Tax=Achromobacter sp. ACM02 TaxID=2769305 RepID=UPI00177CDF81|nr:glycosyltransferase [Achromobacter sp. ACM02]MBD9383730.1 glycosyltransferase [Achromobacter sp. ACM02]
MNLKEIGAFANFGAETYRLLPEHYRFATLRPVPWPSTAADYVVASGGRALVLGDFYDAPADAGLTFHPISGVDAQGVPHIWYFDNWAGYAEEIIGKASAPHAWVVSSGFLSALLDPRPMLRALKRLCLEQGAEVFFVHANGEGIFRTWTEGQFREFLKASGFELATPPGGTGLEVCIATITPQSYQAYLRRQGLAPELLDVDFLLISTEDATVRATGGIGTYVKNIKALDRRAAVLMCDIDLAPAGLDGRTLVPRMFVDSLGRENFFDGLGLIEVCRAILYLLPRVAVLESQDYKSIAYRLVQSKRTGGLPQSIQLRVFMHGSIDYMKYGVQDESAMDYTPYELGQAVRDSYIFQQADECYAPSRYLAVQLLQEEFGYSLNNLSVRRLPFDLSTVPGEIQGELTAIKRIVFVGKYSRLKGWPDFVAAMEGLYDAGNLTGIEEIVSLGPVGPGNEDRARLERLCAYKDYHLSHSELLAFLAKHRCDSLFVVPSRGENYPFVILEQMLMGTRLVAYNTGGAVEVVDDEEFVRAYFSDPHAAALQKKIGAMLVQDVRDSDQELRASRQRVRDRQISVNRGWSREAAQPAGLIAMSLPDLRRCEITVVIPVYNTSMELVDELLRSLLGSRVRPSEVILVDDGSADGYGAGLSECVERALGGVIKWRVHSQANRGLAGARNAGLALSTTPYTFFIDSDDLLLPATLEEAWIALQLDPDLVIATGFAVHFSEQGSLPKTPEPARDGWFWKPLGIPEARALAMLENQYLTANVMARTAALRESGGWDERDKSTWEDWAFFSKLAWEGKRFSLIPSMGYLYRNTPGSMSKTYNRYFGRRRLIRNIAGMSRLDANALFSLINVDSGGGAQLKGPSLSEKEVELINLLRSLIQKPRLRRLVVAGYRWYTKVRRFFR